MVFFLAKFIGSTSLYSYFMARSVASAGSTFMHGRFLGRNTFQLFAAQILTRWLFAISANVNEFHFFSFFGLFYGLYR